MAAHIIFENKKVDGLGISMTNTGTVSAFAITLQGTLDQAFVNVLMDISGGTDWVTIGRLGRHNTSKLFLLPAGASCTALLQGASENTDVTVKIGG